MTELVIDRLPRGEIAVRQLVDAVVERGDTVERHYLEVKSAVDLRTKIGQAKLVKFILGAANRRPEVAAQAFEGHAIMILGVSVHGADGNPPIEMMELSRNLEPYLSSDGPKWDVQRLPVDDGNEVLLVIVDPPTDGLSMFVCKKNGEGLVDGGIYFRADGETRQAKSEEIAMLLARATASTPETEVRVESLGSATFVTCNRSLSVDPWIEAVTVKRWKSYELHVRAESPASFTNFAEIAALTIPRMSALIGEKPEPRTREAYESQIDAWGDEVRASWPSAFDETVSARLGDVRFTIVNESDTYLTDVELRIHLEGDVDALDWVDPQRKNIRSELPVPPREWGPLPSASAAEMLRYQHVQYAASSPYVPSLPSATQFRNSGSVDIEMSVGDLRPRQAWTSDEDHMVLVLRTAGLAEVQGTWAMTARDHHRVYRGTLTVSVASPVDLTAQVRRELDL
ncbi:hypothetical protein [Cryobacterium sp. PH31-O1]|uniref:hypothetical protein n=1 Tax=Cryobacterium sp. PH31-O1 TaxID=3046306 RepID=UPI0024BA48E8|nr:hypothetical protein [Cryobacterium sp. PH31-O1]MDJ0338696.1 hypothetical protein [Cryobacterium sp. PH31-O1]